MKILIEFQQQEYIMKFLMGLKESYSNIRGQILLSDPLPPINKVFSLILQIEKQREIAFAILPTPDSLAFFSRSSDTRSGFVPLGMGTILAVISLLRGTNLCAVTMLS